MSQQQQGDQRVLVVTSCREVKRGQGQKGEWVLYELGVTKQTGEPIDAKFNAFADLTSYIGKPTEYTVTYKDHETYGRSFTLKPPRRDYARELDELRARIVRLESQLGGQPSTSSPAPGPAAAPAQAAPAVAGFGPPAGAPVGVPDW